MKRPTAAALALSAALLGFGAAQAQGPVAFVTCPVMRDTATVPCWLAEHDGALYYLTAQDAGDGVTQPLLGHRVLVEGEPGGESVCGGKALSDVRVSVFAEPDPACNVVLPAGGTAAPATLRGPGPAATAAAAAAAATAPPSGLEGSQQFEVYFPFGRASPVIDTGLVEIAAAYVQANPEAEIRVQGYRAAIALTGGGVLEEPEGIDLRRAHALVEALARLGVDTDEVLVVDNPDPEAGDYTRRRAVIEVVMGGSDDHTEH
jgi:outer membrane protein OmpA-like peptidoglycan-associated protein